MIIRPDLEKPIYRLNVQTIANVHHVISMHDRSLEVLCNKITVSPIMEHYRREAEFRRIKDPKAEKSIRDFNKFDHPFKQIVIGYDSGYKMVFKRKIRVDDEVHPYAMGDGQCRSIHIRESKDSDNPNSGIIIYAGEKTQLESELKTFVENDFDVINKEISECIFQFLRKSHSK